MMNLNEEELFDNLVASIKEHGIRYAFNNLMETIRHAYDKSLDDISDDIIKQLNDNKEELIQQIKKDIQPLVENYSITIRTTILKEASDVFEKLILENISSEEEKKNLIAKIKEIIEKELNETKV